MEITFNDIAYDNKLSLRDFQRRKVEIQIHGGPEYKSVKVEMTNIEFYRLMEKLKDTLQTIHE
jgi:hypothetical protein